MKKLFSLLFVLHGFSLFAQQFPSIDNIPMDDVENPVKIPNSPEVTQFTKYGNVDVSLYTGRPNISIPIYNLQGKEVSVPISLSYDASGIKVEQISTRVGLGWNVNVGGTVTRNVNGEVDVSAFAPGTETSSFDNYMNDFIDMARTENLNPGTHLRPWSVITNYITFLDRYASGKYTDTKPDTYSFNLNGHSGSFYIDRAGKPICINDPSIKIEVISSSPYYGWKFTMADGSIYHVDKPEVTNYENTTAQKVINYASAWHLTKIESPNKVDVITFHYNDTPWTKKQRFTENKSIKEVPQSSGTLQQVCSGSVTQDLFSSSYKINQVELSYISLNNDEQRVLFTSGANREDLEGTKKLESIHVTHKSGISPKKVTFEQSYLTSGVENGFEAETGKRLKLNKVIFQETNSGGGSLVLTGEKHEYSFTYYEDQPLPFRHSKSQDFWGYFNGKPNTTLIPKYDYTVPPLAGADRSVSIAHARSGSLKQITYPTGGTSEFTYESNMLGSHETLVNKQRAIASVVGTGNDNSTYNYKCHGVFPNGDFKVSHGYFKVGSGDGYYKLKLSLAIDTSKPAPSSILGQPNNQLALIVPTSYYDCYLNPSAPGCNTINDSNDICAFVASNTAVYTQYFISTNEGTGYSMDLNLAPGTYKVFLVNRSPAVTMTLTEEYQEAETKPAVAGGLRIKKIVDKTDATAVAQTKFYHYDEIKSTDTLNLDYFDGNNNEGNGRLNIPAIFDKRVNEKTLGDCNPTTGCAVQLVTCELLLRSSNNLAETFSSNIVSYNKVTETKFDGTNFNGYTTYEFYNDPEDITKQSGILNGKLKSKKVFNINKTLLEDEVHTYEKVMTLQNGQAIDNKSYGINIVTLGKNMKRWRLLYQNSTDPTKGHFKYDENFYSCSEQEMGNQTSGNQDQCVIHEMQSVYCSGATSCSLTSYGDYSYHYFVYQPVWSRLKQSVYTSKLNGQDIVKTVDYTYGNEKHFQMTKMITTTSEGKTIDKRLYYPDDMPLPGGALTQNEAQALSSLQKANKHRLNTVVQTEVYHDSNKLVGRKRVNYKQDGDRVIPKAILTAPTDTTLETRIEYLKYDDKTNPLEVRQANGTVVSYIWGHDKTLPVAKIENATYVEIATALGITETQLLAYNETNMSNLDGLRANANLSKAMITTYTYKPLVGMTSTIDARGYKTTYDYDHFGRLVTVKDAEGNILTSNKYNYKQ